MGEKITVLENPRQEKSSKRIFYFLNQNKKIIGEVVIPNHNPNVISNLADKIVEKGYEVITPKEFLVVDFKVSLSFIDGKRLEELISIKNALLKMEK